MLVPLGKLVADLFDLLVGRGRRAAGEGVDKNGAHGGEGREHQSDRVGEDRDNQEEGGETAADLQRGSLAIRVVEASSPCPVQQHLGYVERDGRGLGERVAVGFRVTVDPADSLSRVEQPDQRIRIHTCFVGLDGHDMDSW
ncbi:hypothetical protein ACFU51_12655 [Streptomyces sp. NPDC057430]|uniref:hypothetical protein n=1 Tax=Streptomyces sp. NPDC057430 TaxID=3346131 RepID=UPI00368B0EBF